MSFSDLILNVSKFKQENISSNTQAVNNYILSQATKNTSEPKWWEMEAQAFRDLQDQEKTSWPAPTYRLPRATYINVPSRETGRNIKCRLVLPENGNPEGVFLHIHGGGHVLAHCDWFDDLLDVLSKASNLAIISPEYRLAPEHPFPCGPEDIYDIAKHLITQSATSYGGPLTFIGGESAGATLTALTVLHLLETHPEFSFKAAIMIYGLYDWSLSPSARTWTNPLIMTSENIVQFGNAYLGDRSPEQRRDAAISPIYHQYLQIPGSQVAKIGEERKEVKLPPAFFLCGTQDATLDDTVLMSFRWQINGGEVVVKFVEGAPHGLLLFGIERVEMTAKGFELLAKYVKGKL